MHFATKTTSVWEVSTHYIRRGDKSEFTATQGDTPANPYLIGAESPSGRVNLVRPQASGYTTIIPHPVGRGLSASATSPNGVPTALQVMGGELYVFTPDGDEWVGQPTGLFPVFDYVQVRELSDLAFLADGRMVIAYWNGDHKSFHLAIGAPGNWQDTEIILPTKDRAVDVALAVNGMNSPGLAVTFDSKDVYYIENIPGPTTLLIDIRPGSLVNPVNLKSRGVLPVAVLGSEELDVSLIDPDTVTLEGVAPRVSGNSTHFWSLQDVNGDSVLDLMLHFNLQELTIDPESVELTLEGLLTDGTAFKGSASIRIVPPGDVNGNGRVDGDDLSLLLANWGATTDWEHGEFSGAPPVSDADLSVILANWNMGSPTGAAAIPEPASALILLLGLPYLARRRARR